MDMMANTFEAEIDQIVTETFQTMLATEVQPSSAIAVVDNNVVTALVSFAGDWRGTLTLACASEHAVAFARRFLQDDSLSELNADVCDALGELGNIIAGNLKTVLSPGLRLGTPSVVEGKDYAIRICGGRTVNECHFCSDIGKFVVCLVEHGEPS